MAGSRHVSNLLGIAGLIPFVAPAVLVAVGGENTEIYRRIGEVYAFGIICFLTGSWWGMSLKRENGKALLLSNLYFLAAFFIFLFAAQWWSLAAAILLMSLYFAEHSSSLFPDLADHYRKLRALLTMVASISMLTLYLLA